MDRGMKSRSASSGIAVVGMACRYPGAQSLREFWENVLARRQQFRRMPDCRLPLSDYHDPDPAAPDKTYLTRAALLDGFQFDPVARRIPRSTVESTDIVHWLALETALLALEDAGYGRDNVPTERSGVLLGNTLTGEQTRAETMRLRWPFVRRTLVAAAEGLPPEVVERLAEVMERYYKSAFVPITEDTLAGGLSNTIAGRICNFLDFHGGGYTVDGACSSSLIAIATAAAALENRDLDLALAGGVDVSLDPFELVGFAKTGALTSKEMRVYDRRASGFIPGEGCGFVVLKRLEDARSDGDYVYAVLRGYGISSDGRGGITAPSAKGQAAAIRRAYERAGYEMTEIAFVEGHGTGTAVGDPAELEGIALALGAAALPRSCGVTSFKSIVGHTKAAAGIGGFIKAVMAVNRRVLPPTAGCSEPHPIFDDVARALYPIVRGEVRDPARPLRAGVTGAGFGGINCHVTIESGDAPAEPLAPTIEERALLVSHQSTEVFPVSASSPAALDRRIREVARLAEGLAVCEMTDLAAHLAQELHRKNRFRAAVVAGNPEDLGEHLERARELLAAPPPAGGGTATTPDREVWIGHAGRRNRVGFIFPGQGSQRLNMAWTLIERHPWARELRDRTSAWLRAVGAAPIEELIFRPTDRAADGAQTEEWEGLLKRTEVAQPAICLASMLWLRLLTQLGIRPAVVGGHSLGELSAFQAAGAFSEEQLIGLAGMRGAAMSAPAGEVGSMVALACGGEEAEALLRRAGGYAVVANLNSPRQTVISGEVTTLEQVLQLAATEHIPARRLSVSTAFHSRLVARAAETLRTQAPIPVVMGETTARLVSAMDGREVRVGADLRDYFSRQVLAPVNFIALVQTLAQHCDLLLEVGPGSVLSNLIADIRAGAGPVCLPVESRPGRDRDLNIVLAAFFAGNGDPAWRVLCDNRLAHPFVAASERQFIRNPCEKPLRVDDQTAKPVLLAAAAGEAESELARAVDLSREELTGYLAARGGFLGAVIRADLGNAPVQPLPGAEEKRRKKREIPAESPTLAPVGPTAASPEPEGPGSIEALLLNLVSRRTGFPSDTLAPGMRLLDDLNLDSIKTAELIAEAAKALDIAGRLDPSRYARADLATVTAALRQAVAERAAGGGAEGDPALAFQRPIWVRNFAIDLVPGPLPEADPGFGDWAEERVLVLTEPGERDVGAEVARRLERYGAEVTQAFYAAAASPGRLPVGEFTTCIGILPRAGDPTAPHTALLSVVVDRLRIPAILCDPSRRDGPTTVVWVQFGGGLFGVQSSSARIEQCCATAMAAGFHLERPELKVRVLDFESGADSERLAELVGLEIQASGAYAAVSYDSAFTRHVPQSRPDEPSDYLPLPIRWSAEDVILVTGGAKGITAECALAFAEATGARMALVGSTPYPGETAPDPDAEIAGTLERYRAAGLAGRYFPCDVTDRAAVEALVSRVRREMGEVTGVIHGAGLNRARRFEEVSTEEACREIAPKVLGARNLCLALHEAPLKLFIGFSSIIGITGMPGNAWYGFANEALDLVLAGLRRRRPDLAVVSLAFSIWEQIGMGARMGSLETLAARGVAAIPVSEGLQRFLHLTHHDPGRRLVVVAARLGGLDTWRYEEHLLPADFRYLEKVRSFTPGVELVAEARLTLKRDASVREHMWRGSFLFPAVFGLEAMAQAVAGVAGVADFGAVRIEDIRLARPIVVDPERGVRVLIYAEATERAPGEARRTVRAGITTERTNFAEDHFSATFVFGAAEEPQLEIVDLPSRPLDVDPPRDLYSWLLFQGPRFQRIRSIYRLDSRRCVFTVSGLDRGDAEHQADPAEPQSRWLLGDPFLRDALLQSMQIVVSQDICLPVSIGALTRYTPHGETPEELLCVSDLLDHSGDLIQGTVFALGADGRAIERLDGYLLKTLEHHPENPTPEEIADPGPRDEAILRRELAYRAEGLGLITPEIAVAYAPGIREFAKDERRDFARHVLQRVVARAMGPEAGSAEELPLRWLESGEPVLEGSGFPRISFSHADGRLLCVAGAGFPQGCDLVPLGQRDLSDWQGLLGEEYPPLLRQLMADGDSADVAGSRIWAAREALFKSGITPRSELNVDRRLGDGVLFRSGDPSAPLRFLTFPAVLTLNRKFMVALTCKAGRESRVMTPGGDGCRHIAALGIDTGVYSFTVEDGPGGEPVFVMRFPVTFREAANPSRTLRFTHYFSWIGSLREIMVQPIYEQLVEQFSSGEWGMVTNYAETAIVGEARSGDVVEGRLRLERISGKAGSTLEFRYEWWKMLPLGGREPIAFSSMGTTWVAVRGRGEVEVRPFPDFGRHFIEKLLPRAAHRSATPDQPAPAPGSELGPEIARAPEGPAQRSRSLREETFETSLEDANLVGNIYFSHYYTWQGRVLDRFFAAALPEYVKSETPAGELRCLYCRVDHVHEAMPFDRILVRMYAAVVFERGVRLRFDYFRLGADGREEKLAFGEHTAQWVEPAAEGAWMAAPLPEGLRRALTSHLAVASTAPPTQDAGPVPAPSPKQQNREPRPEYDVIVVGSGVGGLSAAALCAKRGFRVLVLEQHYKPGGFCTSWERIVRRNGERLRYVFDAGVHDVAGIQPERAIGRLERELGIRGRIEWLRVDHEYVLPGRGGLKVPRRVEDFIEALAGWFPEERQGLQEFFAEVRVCYDAVYGRRPRAHLLRWADATFPVFLNAYLRNHDLKSLFTALTGYLTDDPEALSVSTAIPLFTFYFEGGHYPRGGSQVIADVLVSSIHAHQGVVRLSTPVSRIMIEQGRANGVELADGAVVHGRTVVSNADTLRTFMELVGPEHLPLAFADRISSLRPSCSVFQMFLGVDFVPPWEPVTFVPTSRGTCAVNCPSKVDPSLAPPGHAAISVISLMSHQDAGAWRHDEPGYKARKHAFGEDLLSAIEELLPGLRNHIVFREEATPATVSRFAWTTGGAIYGLAIDQWHPPATGPLEGLYLSGAGTTRRPGVEDAVRSGILAADAVCNEIGHPLGRVEQ
ncbi:MAG TPA: SDR family NAD(P)-dependent oxidoreductase [Candidatus Methanoperedens sp.]|nr:SDR family NAD(P)-dependent oxidoreductase [Candidatus Methanoperedens sp.]